MRDFDHRREIEKGKVKGVVMRNIVVGKWREDVTLY